MAKIYDKKMPPPDRPRGEGPTPYTDTLPDVRMFFHPGGASFGWIDPADDRFSAVMDYAEVLARVRKAAGMDDLPRTARRPA